MNNERRKKLRKIQEELSGLLSIAQDVRSDEEEAADSLEEHFPGSEQAERAQEALSACEEIESLLEELDAIIDTAIDG